MEPQSRRQLGIAIALVLAIVVLGVAFLANRSPAEADPNRFQAQLTSLANAYKQGQQARTHMRRHGIAETPERCVEMFRSTDAANMGGTEEFQARGEDFFLAGCLNRKKPQ
jgi:hypothetical protein